MFFTVLQNCYVFIPQCLCLRTFCKTIVGKCCHDHSDNYIWNSKLCMNLSVGLKIGSSLLISRVVTHHKESLVGTRKLGTSEDL